MADTIYLEQIARMIRDGAFSPEPILSSITHIATQHLVEANGTDARRKVVVVPRPVNDPPKDEDAGTKIRRETPNVGRRDSADSNGTLPVATTSVLAKQTTIQQNVIETEQERPTEYGYYPNYVGRFNETEVPWDEIQVAIGKIKGNRGNPVDIKPKTDDRVNKELEDKAAQKARSEQNAAIGQPGATMKEEEQLDELFDQPYPHEIKQVKSKTREDKAPIYPPATHTKATFSTDNKNQYQVSIVNHPEHPQSEVYFETGQGDIGLPDKPIEPHTAHRVLSTVRSAMDTHCKANPHIEKLHFSAVNKEPSRVRLYHHLAKMYDPEYQHGEDPDKAFTHFSVRNPHHKSVDEEHLAETRPLIPYDPVTKIAVKAKNKKIHSLQSLAQKFVEEDLFDEILLERYASHGYSNEKWNQPPRSSFASNLQRMNAQTSRGIRNALNKHKREMATQEKRAVRAALIKAKQKQKQKNKIAANAKKGKKTP